MPSPSLLRVFLSSPGDVATERELANQLIRAKLAVDPSFRGRVAFDVITWDDPHAAVPLPAHLTPQAAIALGLPRPSECEIVIVILWSRLGTPLPPEYKKPNGQPYRSGTEWEYHDALSSAQETGQPILLLYRRTETPTVSLIDPDLTEKQLQFSNVSAFFDELRNKDGSLASGVQSYQTPQQFATLLEQNLRSVLIRLLDVPFESHGPATTRKVVPFQAPPPPSYYVERPEVMEALKDLFRPSQRKESTFVVGALHGLGGIGKTAAVSRLCYDEEIKTIFSDGVLWATLGQQPDLLFWLTSWIRALGDFDYRVHDTLSASIHLRSLVQRKKLLFVVDDVWKFEHARPFLLGGGDSCLIITTRRRDLADELGAVSHSLGLMKDTEAATLLKRRIATKHIDLSDDVVHALVRSVDYLPLAVELLAAQLLRSINPAELLHKLQQEAARLDALSTPRERRTGRNRIEACFNLSLDTLRTQDGDAWNLFVQLGLLPEDAIIESNAIANLLLKPKKSLEDLLQVLLDDSLLILTSLPTDSSQKYRMHDLLHDISRKLIAHPPPKGLGRSNREMQRELLEALQTTVRSRAWSAIRTDGYIERQLVWHMLEAERPDWVHQLLSERKENGRLAWLAVRERHGQLDGFVSDLQLIFQRCLQIIQNAAESSQVEAEVACLFCLRYALILSTVVGRASAIPPEYLEIMVIEKLWAPLQALSYASHMLYRDVRFEAYSFLMGYQDTATRQSYEIEQLKDISREREKGERWTRATINFRHLGPAIQTAILKLIDKEQGPDYGISRVEAERLARLAPYFDLDRRQVLLRKFSAETDLLARTILMTALVTDGKPKEAKEIAISTYAKIHVSSAWARDYALTCLLPLLDAKEFKKAIPGLVERVSKYHVRYELSKRLLPHANTDQINTLLSHGIADDDETYRVIGRRVAEINGSLAKVRIARPRHVAIAHCCYHKQRGVGNLDELGEIVDAAASDFGDKELFTLLGFLVTGIITEKPIVVRQELSDFAKKACALFSLAFSNGSDRWIFEGPVTVVAGRGLMTGALFESRQSMSGYDRVERRAVDPIDGRRRKFHQSDFSRLVNSYLADDETESLMYDENSGERGKSVERFYRDLTELSGLFNGTSDGARLGQLCAKLRLEHVFQLLQAIRRSHGPLGREALFVCLNNFFRSDVRVEYQPISNGRYQPSLDVAWLLARSRPRQDLIQCLILIVVALQDEVVKRLGSRLLDLCSEFGSTKPV